MTLKNLIYVAIAIFMTLTSVILFRGAYLDNQTHPRNADYVPTSDSVITHESYSPDDIRQRLSELSMTTDALKGANEFIHDIVPNAKVIYNGEKNPYYYGKTSDDFSTITITSIYLTLSTEDRRYVLVHEACHILSKDMHHDDSFYNELDMLVYILGISIESGKRLEYRGHWN